VDQQPQRAGSKLGTVRTLSLTVGADQEEAVGKPLYLAACGDSLADDSCAEVERQASNGKSR
jgi:hypothetical protein